MLAEMAPSPLALLSDRTLITPPNAINASFSVWTVDGQLHWVFKDVLPGGVAARAGIKAGDVLLSVGGKPVNPFPSDGAARVLKCTKTSKLLFCAVILRRN